MGHNEVLLDDFWMISLVVKQALELHFFSIFVRISYFMLLPWSSMADLWMAMVHILHLLQVRLPSLGNGDNSLRLHDVGKKLHHFRLCIFFVWLLGCDFYGGLTWFNL